MKKLGCGLMVVLLGGCAQGMADLGPPVAVTPTNGDVSGLDVYGPDRADQPSLPGYRGQSMVQVRTYLDPPGSGNREETPAACSITGGTLFTAEVETPRKIIVPNYGARSVPLSAECDIAGARASGSSVVFNRTKRDIQSAGASNGLLGLFVAAVVAEAVSDENDEYEYAPLVVSREE